MPKSQSKQFKPTYKFESAMVQIDSGVDLPGIKSLPHLFILWFRRVVGNALPRITPLRQSGKSGLPSLTEMAAAFGFSANHYKVALETHQKRLSNRVTLMMLMVMPIFVLLIFIPFLYILLRVEARWWHILLAVMVIYPVQSVLIKMVLVVVDRYYADSLCIQASIGVLIELADPTVLENPSHKRFLLQVIGDVARRVLLLPLCFRSSSEFERELIRKHFHRMEHFVRERERKATIPTKDTLTSLRKDFMELTWTFITGNYSHFEWQAEKTEAAIEHEAEKRWYQSLGTWAAKFVGTLMPIAVLYYIIARPVAFSGLPIDTKFITIVMLAWLFLSIDSLFSLGVTSKITSLAKEIKALT